MKESVPDEKEKIITNPLENESKRFALLFDSVNARTVNKNISSELYNYETYEKMSEESDEENVWKNRTLLENTLTGNIAMHYDLYRQGFAYYSDRSVDYSVLNQCAMKYVRIFFCRDFFVDTIVMPDSFQNPFNKMKETEEIRLKEVANTKRKELKLNFDTSVFVKKPKIEPVTSLNIAKTDANNIYKNKFRWVGKISGDWTIIQPVIQQNKGEERLNISGCIDIAQNTSAKNSYSLWKIARNA